MNIGYEIILGESNEVLNRIPNNSIQCCITSPPYWGLRDYGIIGQIGSELDYNDYIDKLVQIFNKIKNILTETGTLWLNIGDSYTSGNRRWRDSDKKNPHRGMDYRPPTPDGLKPKDLIGIPWHLAFALQKDGWFLRSDIIWYKPNCQPESVKDRPTRSHEYLFLLSKSKTYLYNYEDIKEPSTTNPEIFRNKRTVWSIPTEPNEHHHQAMFPEGLVYPCIIAGSNPGDTVLDPFVGSGTVGVVAKKTGRSFIGIDVNPEYVLISKNRIGEIL